MAETQRKALLFALVNRNDVADGLPDLFAVVGHACRHRDGSDGVEIAAQLGVGFGALLAPAQVAGDAPGVRRFLVIVLDQLFFGEMVHAFTFKGASSRRSFCTARKTACFAALGAMRSVAAISSGGAGFHVTQYECGALGGGELLHRTGMDGFNLLAEEKAFRIGSGVCHLDLTLRGIGVVGDPVGGFGFAFVLHVQGAIDSNAVNPS